MWMNHLQIITMSGRHGLTASMAPVFKVLNRSSNIGNYFYLVMWPWMGNNYKYVKVTFLESTIILLLQPSCMQLWIATLIRINLNQRATRNLTTSKWRFNANRSRDRLSFNLKQWELENDNGTYVPMYRMMRWNGRRSSDPLLCLMVCCFWFNSKKVIIVSRHKPNQKTAQKVKRRYSELRFFSSCQHRSGLWCSIDFICLELLSTSLPAFDSKLVHHDTESSTQLTVTAQGSMISSPTKAAVCPHCDHSFTLNNFISGRRIVCVNTSCGKTFQQVTCPHCSGSNIWKDANYNEGKVIACAHQNCKKTFQPNHMSKLFSI